jgi:hypothetical protein
MFANYKKNFFISCMVIILFSAVAMSSVYAALAPPVTDIAIVAIQSEDGGYEEINGETKTSIDHNKDIYVGVVEIGYGNGNLRLAKINGSLIKPVVVKPLTTEYSSEAYGFLVMYEIPSHFESGEFVAQTTSENHPGNTMKTSIYIR